MINTYSADVNLAEVSQPRPDVKATLVLLAGSTVVARNLWETHDEDEDVRLQFKNQITQNPLRILVSEKNVILVFKKYFVVLSADDFTVVAAETMSHIYDVTLLDQKTVAMSCKAGSQCVILTYSLETLALVSSITLENLAARVLVPFTNG